MKTVIIKADTRAEIEALGREKYHELESKVVVSFVSIFYDPHDRQETLIMAYHE
ncbi:hypothetical protein [Aquimarina aggregata]|uniref:hypothetical protein n=1 Tax=Aquimarina aggregata TaxID=1642818 RepID=UPI002490F91F|nr:hypothetical protein [Aquimarina aggregata]